MTTSETNIKSSIKTIEGNEQELQLKDALIFFWEKTLEYFNLDFKVEENVMDEERII